MPFRSPESTPWQPYKILRASASSSVIPATAISGSQKTHHGTWSGLMTYSLPGYARLRSIRDTLPDGRHHSASNVSDGIYPGNICFHMLIYFYAFFEYSIAESSSPYPSRMGIMLEARIRRSQLMSTAPFGVVPQTLTCSPSRRAFSGAK